MRRELKLGVIGWALGLLVGCADDVASTGGTDAGHGTVRIEISPLAGDTTIFDGTTEIVATVNYESCLQDFYLTSNPTFQKVGPDGAPVFDAWIAKLCADFSDIPVCSVDAIEQTLIPDNDVYTLQVTYAIEDPESIAYRELHVGPLPTSSPS